MPVLLILFALSVPFTSRIVNIFLEFIKVWSILEYDIASCFIKKFGNVYLKNRKVPVINNVLLVEYVISLTYF